MKQNRLALRLGENWNQQKISYWESKQKIEISALNEIAHALQVPVWVFQIPCNLFNKIALQVHNPVALEDDFYIQKIIELYERLLICEWEKQELLGRNKCNIFRTDGC
ncbi:hypothetical protein KE626_07170 [Chitinophaga sp. 2R12]|uniref:HTH cro/C1-type domain-containing protein n=1 Tax=Chitinophaga hostae TaxID=2831022 RepID=A0ABS5IW49_9BACT|nr:hypothetical protein [Chitinophaga hostae]